MNELSNKGINRKINLERDGMVNYHCLRRSIATNLMKVKNNITIYNIKQLLNHQSVDITEAYLNLLHLDFKENLELYHNELFDGFSNLSNNKPNNTAEVNTPISDLKEKLINSILTMSENEENEMLKISLEVLSEEELKKKLTTYV